MSDLKQVLQELSDALPGIPEAMTRLRTAAAGLDDDEHRLADALREGSEDLREELESLGRSVVAVGEEGSEENQAYVAVVDEITTIVVLEAFAMGSAALPGGGLGPVWAQAAQIEMDALRAAPVSIRRGLEQCRASIGQLHEALDEGERRLEAAGAAVAESMSRASAHLVEGIEAATQAGHDALDTLEALEDGARAEAEDVAEALRQAQASMEAEVEAVGKAVEALGGRLQDDLKARSQALRDRLERALGQIEDAWEDLAKRMSEQGQEAEQVRPDASPLVEGLQVVLSPLRMGIDAVHEGARRLGLR